MNLQVGDVYNKDNVQQNLKAIYKTGYFSEKMKAIPIPTSPDSVTLRIYLEENIPIMFLSFDTQDSDTGMRTRIEAFNDMLLMRKEKKNGK